MRIEMRKKIYLRETIKVFIYIYTQRLEHNVVYCSSTSNCNELETTQTLLKELVE